MVTAGKTYRSSTSGCSILDKRVLVTGIDGSVYTRGLQQNCAIGILEDAMPHREGEQSRIGRVGDSAGEL
jgi:hypothetical protein